MKKILLLLLSGLIVFGIYSYLKPPLSPKGASNYSFNSKEFTVDYSRPYKKGRLIFGKKEDGALVPYDEYWRTGANFSTDLTVSDDFSFGDRAIKKGSYWLYTIPSENTWKIFLNSESSSFGYFEPDVDNNIAEIIVDSYELENELEQFTISFVEQDNQLFLRLLWDKTGVSIPVN